ncbi:hypothetical protein IE53DRAFT_230406 [Violaceomyces palustris]|uniref:Uncharacterized protein n=1 Tax=Violaceomyces palustris TaxID=1673888 RepID=A0ACD0P4G5_9BASI|nr:hypothetical protein IE53DRAFT_230406 [Violaceomyces palustris]
MSRHEIRRPPRHKPTSSSGSAGSHSNDDGVSLEYRSEKGLKHGRLQSPPSPSSIPRQDTSIDLIRSVPDMRLPPMGRTDSDDRHWFPRYMRHAEEDLDNVSVKSFNCSLALEFDRQKREGDNRTDGPALNVEARQNWLDSTFKRLTNKGRKKKLQSRPAGKDADEEPGYFASDISKVKPSLKPHFLDLSGYISPVPLGRSTPASPTVPNSASSTPRPKFAQRFASSDTTPINAAPVVPVGGPNCSPCKMGFRVALPSDDGAIGASSPASASFPRPSLRSRRSFDNPGEVRRRQKEEWNFHVPRQKESQMPQLPEWARDSNRSLSISSTASSSASSSYYTANGTDSRRPSESGNRLPFPASSGPSGVSPTRSVGMTRGASHDPAFSGTGGIPRPSPMIRASSNNFRQGGILAMTEAQSPPSFERSLPPFSSPPPSLVSSRASCGSSTGSESFGSAPQTPVSATYQKVLPGTQPPTPTRKVGHSLKEEEEILAFDREKEILEARVNVAKQRRPGSRDQLKDSTPTNALRVMDMERHLLEECMPGTQANYNLYSRYGKRHANGMANAEASDTPTHSEASSKKTSGDMGDGERQGLAFPSSNPKAPPSPPRQTSLRSRIRAVSCRGRSATVSSSVSVETAGSGTSSRPSEEENNNAGHKSRPLSIESTSDSVASSDQSSPHQLAYMQRRRRANSRAEEWASSIGRRFARGLSGKDRMRVQAAIDAAQLSDSDS